MQDISTVLDIIPRIAQRYLFYLRSQRWSPKQLETYQDKKLRQLILHAGRQVPYYRKLFEEIGLDPESFRGRADMHRIPLLDKETLRRQTEEFIADNAKKFKPQWCKTSGSTGTPLQFMVDADCRANDAAVTMRSLQWAGYYPGKRIFTVKGWVSETWEFRYNMLGTSLNFDSVQMSKESAIRVLEEINKLKPHVYYGYANSLAMLVKIAREEGIEIPRGQSVIAVGETLTEHTRKLLEETYGARVFDYYSMTENAVMITECEHGSKHVIEDYAYHEFLTDQGKNVTQSKGEIVGTSYYSYAMPLIRYRTRDYAKLKPAKKSCMCGRQFRIVEKIEGRKEDYLHTPDGKMVNLVEGAISMGKGIMVSQYVQDTPDHMYVNIVPGPDFEKESLKEVEKGLRLRVGDAIGIDFRIVPELERTSAGKIPFLISKIGKNLYSDQDFE